jgi:GT2 family glycosyltransferase
MLSAAETLKLRGQTLIEWAVFDPAWYLRAYPAIRHQLANDDPATLLRHYLDHGQRRGHSPNRFFDEAWHRDTDPGVAAAIRDGTAASAFDLYCRGGYRTRDPHWLFQELAYRVRYPDLTDAIESSEIVNGYDHYLRHGDREHRFGHPLFDAGFYLTRLPPDEQVRAEALGPFQHYLASIDGARTDLQTSPAFDPDWYLGRYPELQDAIALHWRSALHHYLTNDTPIAFDPLPEFSERYYLGHNPDVALAVERGDYRNGYQHFLQYGANELRSPSASIDLRYYAAHRPVKAALKARASTDPFSHYLTTGHALGLAAVEPPEERIAETQAATLFRRRATALLPLYSRRPIDFTCAGHPTISVIMVTHNQLALTLTALGSLRANYPGAIELILVDSGSTDETRQIGQYVHGAKLLPFQINIDDVRACNAALQVVSADRVLLLKNNVELAAGAVANAVARLASDPAIGAVGGKVIRGHGLLQEAGNILWHDGSTSSYLREALPLTPEANFVRDVHFCSSVFLMLHRGWVEKIDGLDGDFTLTHYADADLCVRLAAAGARVVYDPAVVVHRLDADLSDASERESAMAADRQNFVRKHAGFLDKCPAPDPTAAVFARFAEPCRRRVLFIEDLVPLRRIGSGFVRSNDILRAMVSLNYQVSVVPLDDNDADVAAIFGDLPDTIEVMHDRTLSDLALFLAARADYYDIIWIARTHNFGRAHAIIARTYEASARRPSIILDVEAIAALRDSARARLTDGASFDQDKAIEQEFARAASADHIVAVNQQEAAILRQLRLPKISVIGHMRDPTPTPGPFSKRAGMLFVGAIHDTASPNYDSICWFVEQVLPLVEQSLGWETHLTIVGYTADKVALDQFRDHPRLTLRGMIADLVPLYDSHRLFVAPTRYAAGAPYKLYEAASYGLPIVATELLCRQVDWTNGVDLLCADAASPPELAKCIVRLYRDSALWTRLRGNALQRISNENSVDNYVRGVSAVLEGRCYPS